MASTKSHNSWSDILALCGLRNRPPWPKTRSTAADVHDVQKVLSKSGFKHANCLLSLTRCQGIPAPVPSSISWMNKRYEAMTVGREMFLSVIIHQGLENIQTFSSRPRLSSRPRSRPRILFQDQDHFSCPRGSYSPLLFCLTQVIKVKSNKHCYLLKKIQYVN